MTADLATCRRPQTWPPVHAAVVVDRQECGDACHGGIVNVSDARRAYGRILVVLRKEREMRVKVLSEPRKSVAIKEIDDALDDIARPCRRGRHGHRCPVAGWRSRKDGT